MPLSIHCPHCKKYTSLSMGVNKDSRGHDYEASVSGGIYYWWIGICHGCEKAVLVEVTRGSSRNNPTRIDPNPQPSPSDPAIPQDLRRDLDEAKMCASVACFQAAAVMARRTIQLACVEKGCDPNKRLVDQIASLTAQGQITKDIEEWATVVRFLGNDAAHPGADIVGQEEAEDCLAVAEQFLHVLFVTPALAKQRLAARKKATP